MTQNATVLQILEDGRARIVVARQSACAHDCSQCGGCGATVKPVYALAVNEIGAAAGDRVEVESSSRTVLLSAAVVYLLPILLFFAGYFLLQGHAGEGLAYAGGGCGFLLGLLAAVLWDRRLKRRGGVEFRVVRKL